MATQVTTDQDKRLWLKKLTHELYQTERSAVEHPEEEGKRLGQTPPGRAMLDVAAHAHRALRELDPLIEALDLPDGAVGEQVGQAFSWMRRFFADKLLTLERSYRGTVLGMTHGLDMVHMLCELLEGEPNGEELREYLKRWEEERRPLVEKCREQISWFCAHPEIANRSVDEGVVAQGVRGVFRGVGMLQGGQQRH